MQSRLVYMGWILARRRKLRSASRFVILSGMAILLGSSTAPTVSHLLGEMTWLITQSPLHKAMQIGDLEWLAMPALINQQFYLFRDGDQPVGLALWAKCNAAAEKKLEGGMIEPENRLTLEEWTSGENLVGKSHCAFCDYSE